VSIGHGFLSFLFNRLFTSLGPSTEQMGLRLIQVVLYVKTNIILLIYPVWHQDGAAAT